MSNTEYRIKVLELEAQKRGLSYEIDARMKRGATRAQVADLRHAFQVAEDRLVALNAANEEDEVKS